MAEIRLIDGNELRGIESLLNTDIIQSSKEASWLMTQVLHDIDAMPTIDPETLPIVQELQEKLERVTEERDALLKEFSGECGMCLYYEDCIKNHYSCGGCEWEWRGIQEVQDDE